MFCGQKHACGGKKVSLQITPHLLLCLCSAFDYDTENMNSEDIYSSLKGVTEAIQNFSVRSQEDMNEPVQRREGEEVSGGGQHIRDISSIPGVNTTRPEWFV